MLTALLKGKLSSEQENMEDVLTSSVFGTFQYSENAGALAQFLKKSKPVCGDIPIKNYAMDLAINFEDYVFWPQWTGLEGVDNCEPDLVIRIQNASGKNFLVVIEAKFHSGKSSFPSVSGNISDQLAKQWVHLFRKAEKESCTPWLVYLTADTAAPKSAILEAKDELLSKLGYSVETQQLRISWLSWREIFELFKHSDRQQLLELSSLAKYLGLLFFNGMGRFNALPELNYQFCVDTKRFDWKFSQPLNSDWEFIDDQR